MKINETLDTVIATTVVAPTSITTENDTNINTNSNISEKKKLHTLAVPDFVCTKCDRKTYNGHCAKHKKSCLNKNCNKVTTTNRTTATTTINRTTATSTTIIERIRQIVGSSSATYCALQIALGSYCIDTSTFFSEESAWSTLSVEDLFRRQALGQRLIAALTQSSVGELTAEEEEYKEMCPYDIDADGNIDVDVYADVDDDDYVAVAVAVDDNDDDDAGGDIDSDVGVDIDTDDDTDVGVNGVVAGTNNDSNNINNEYVGDDNDNKLHIEENDDLYQEGEQLESNEDDLVSYISQVAGGGELPHLRRYFADQKSKEVQITTHFAMAALKALTDSGSFFCIDGTHSDVFEDCGFTTGDVMYAMKEDKQNVIRKYGQTPNINNREYTEEQLLRIRITTYFDNLRCEVDINLRKVVLEWVQTMSKSKELHTHQQKIFGTFREGLIDYGIIKAMARQLCKMGANIEFSTTKLDSMEICMSDTTKIDDQKQQVKDAVVVMIPIVKTMTSTTKDPIKTIIVSSWKTSMKDQSYSSKIIANSIICT